MRFLDYPLVHWAVLVAMLGSKNFLGRPVSLLNFPAPILTTLPNIFMNTYQCPFSTCQQWQGVCMSVYSLISSTFKLDHGREIDITFGFFAKSSDSTSGHSAGCGVSFHQDQVLLIYFYLQNSTCRVFLPVREGRNEQECPATFISQLSRRSLFCLLVVVCVI